MADVIMVTTPFQFAKSMHRDLYRAIDPSNSALSAKGKVVIIASAGGGLGAVRTLRQSSEDIFKLILPCQEIARACAQAGAAAIVLTGPTAATLTLTTNNISQIHESMPLITEPTDSHKREPSVKSLFAKIKAKCGKSPRPDQHRYHMDTAIDPRMFPWDPWWSDYVKIVI